MPCCRLALLLVAALAPFAAAANPRSNPAGEKYLAKKAGEPGVITLTSGLMYKVLKEGPSEGAMHPTKDASCSCHYEGKLVDGTVFDSSFKRGQPTDFAPKQVIKGWTEAMQLMVEGDKWELYMPSDMGYGDKGMPPTIPAKSALVFVMELIKINGEKVEAIRCDPSDANKGCNEKELRYIKKIRSKFSGEEGRNALEASVPKLDETDSATHRADALIRWMRKDLGVKTKKGRLPEVWVRRIRRILHKIINPTVRDEA